MGQSNIATPYNGRLLLRQGVNAFKQLQQPIVDLELIEEIRTAADGWLSQEIAELPMDIFNLFKLTGSRKEFEELYFSRRKRLTALGLMAIIQPEKQQYIEGLSQIIEKVCHEYTWCLPAHYDDEASIDLFAAETAFTLAELAELLGDRLPSELLLTMKAEVFRRVLDPFMKQDNIWWEQSEHNWASVCGGSIGAAALYYMRDDDRLPSVLQRVAGAMQCYLQGFLQDGACLEGYGYWQYGFGYYVYFADLLYAYTEGKTNLFANDKVKQIALFQQKCFIGGKHVVNFSDSLSTSGIFMGLTHYLHQLYNEVTIPLKSFRASFTEDHCGRWAPAVRNLLWLQQHEGTAWQAASYPLEQAQWLISTIHQNERTISFAAKGGHNDEPHNHNDMGHFLIAINGKSVLLDLGSGLYTKEYFGEGRYNYICTSSAGHSVPIIAGELQSAGVDYYATLLELTAGEQTDKMSLELSSAYKLEQLSSFIRTFTWDKGNAQLTLSDQFQFADQGEIVTERLIAISKPYQLEEHCLAIDSDEGSLIITFDGEQLDWKTEPFQYLNHFNEPVECYRIDFVVKQPVRKLNIEFQISVR